MLKLPSVSIFDSSDNLSRVIRDCQHGVMYLTDLPRASFSEVGEIFDTFSSDASLGERANAAYTNNLVYKDAHSTNLAQPNTVDMKRVLDLSVDRLQQIKERDPSLVQDVGKSLEVSLAWFENVESIVKAKVFDALEEVIGTKLVDVHSNYRMVDYYERSVQNQKPPRCGEHQDFGYITHFFTKTWS